MIEKLIQMEPKDMPNVLFLGQEGLGQRQDARRLIAHMLSVEEDAIGDSRDFFHINGHEGSIKKEDADRMRSFAGYASQEAEKRVLLIEAADALTIQAQNALLKILEDGSELACFFFLAGKPLLPTIHSRCVTLSYEPLSNDALKTKLEKAGFAVNEDLLLASGGCIEGYHALLAKPEFVAELTVVKEALKRGDTRAVLSSVGCLREADMKKGKPLCLFMRYSTFEMTAFYNYLNQILFMRYMACLGVKLPGFDESLLSYMDQRKVEEVQRLCGKQSEYFRQRRPVTKGDFFCLMCHFCKGGSR